MIRARPHIEAMAPYALADLSLPDGRQAVSLAQNESAFAPSPLAIEAARAAMGGAALYPDADWTGLRAALADVHGIDPASILCGSGSMELISAMIAAFAGPGDEVLSTEHGYALFRTAAEAAGAGYRSVMEPGLAVSVDAVLAGVSPATKIVCVANPGNPTGTVIASAELVRLREQLPEDTLLLIDEAYAEFADQPPLWHLTGRGDTVVMRTFSKAYGLAGMRIGWGVFPRTIGAETRKLLNPNNISVAAQAAAAAATRDQSYMVGVVAKTAMLRNRFSARVSCGSIRPIPGRANFVLLQFANAEAAISADSALRAGGILMRRVSGYGLPDCLRATIGREDTMDRAADILTEWANGEAR